LEKLSRTEGDREINLLLIKMTIVFFKNSYALRSKKDGARRETNIFEDEFVMNYQSELATTNSIVRNILFKYTGDSLFILIACDILSHNLFDNEDLHRIFIKVLFRCDDIIHRLVFYNEEIAEDHPLFTLSQFKLKHKYIFQGCSDWNYAYIFKGFDMMVNEDVTRKDLSVKEYDFLIHILKHADISHGYTEIWKNHFKCARFIISDFAFPDRVDRAIWIMEKFLLSDIHRQILEENYENLQNIFKYLYNNGAETLEHIITTVKSWIESPKSSTILRDGLRKLSEILRPVPIN
jgi:hypothetical protein